MSSRPTCDRCKSVLRLKPGAGLVCERGCPPVTRGNPGRTQAPANSRVSERVALRPAPRPEPNAATVERAVLADLALGIGPGTVQDIADRLDLQPHQVECVLRTLVFSTDVRIDASGPGAWRYFLRGRPVRFGRRAEGVA